MNYFSQEETLSTAGHHFQFLKLAEEAHQLHITLYNPSRKNALHPVMVKELAWLLEYAHQNPRIRLITLGAEGEVFCSGADLRAFDNEGTAASSIPDPDKPILLAEVFKNCHKPIIGHIHADVYAGGMLLVCGCTHIVATKGVRFHLPEVKRGLFPFQVMGSLMEYMPAKKVLDWCTRGYAISVDEAMQYDLVTLIAEKKEFTTKCRQLADELLENAPYALQLGIAAFYELSTLAPAEKQAYLMDKLMRCVQSEDAREGIMAFKEKRPPVWKNA